MSPVLSKTGRQVRSRFLAVLVLRWLPSGLLIPVTTLLMLERGLTLPEVGLVLAAQGFTVLALELPTGALADTIGYRPILLAAGLLALAATGILAFASSLALLLVGRIIQGISRALDSGPLEAWFVESSLVADPTGRLEAGLGAGGAATGIGIACGSLGSGVLIAFGPVGGLSALTIPVVVAMVFEVAHLVAVAVLVRPGHRRGAIDLRGSLLDVPKAIGSTFALLTRSSVVLGLVAVELSWGFGMVAFESLMPVRLAETTTSPQAAAALLGPVAAAAWLVSAGGALAGPAMARWIGPAPTAALLRVVQGATVVVMGLATGPIGVVAAYLGCYAVHGGSNPVHQALLHQQVDGPNRASVLSLASMAAQPAGSVGAIVLTAIAASSSTTLAMIVAGVVLAAAAPLYLPAWRARRAALGPRVSGAPGSAG